mmetsp:Transcript_11398/g.20022  ORF Transcript_11398/g.20022 Transcript_11398/m.20022 type:complete len:92 (+) Transcript_11398:775-1050(+)
MQTVLGRVPGLHTHSKTSLMVWNKLVLSNITEHMAQHIARGIDQKRLLYNNQPCTMIVQMEKKVRPVKNVWPHASFQRSCLSASTSNHVQF